MRTCLKERAYYPSLLVHGQVAILQTNVRLLPTFFRFPDVQRAFHRETVLLGRETKDSTEKSSLKKKKENCLL